MKDTESLTTIFREQGLRGTPQRQAIFRLLVGDDSHPTVESIFDRLMSAMERAGAVRLSSTEIAALTKALGHSDFRQLSRDDLVALTPEAAAVTGLPYDPTYRPAADQLLTEVA